MSNTTHFGGFDTIFQPLDALVLSWLVCPSVYQSDHMQHVDSCYTDFHEASRMATFLLRTVQESRFWSKSDKNDRRLRRAPLQLHLILRSVLLTLTNFSARCCRQNQNTLFKYIFPKFVLSSR